MVFKQIKKLIGHETCRNGNHVQLEISEKFKRFLNKENIERAKLPGNMLKHYYLFLNKSLQPHFVVVHDFEAIIIETNVYQNWKSFKKNKNELFIVKISEHIPIGFSLAVNFLESIERENEYFCYIGEDCSDVFVGKMDGTSTNFATFLRENSTMTNDEKMDYSTSTFFYLNSEKMYLRR